MRNDFERENAEDKQRRNAGRYIRVQTKGAHPQKQYSISYRDKMACQEWAKSDSREKKPAGKYSEKTMTDEDGSVREIMEEPVRGRRRHLI